MKRIVSLFLAVVLLLSVVPPVNVSAANVVDSGTCGDNLTWTLDDAGTLTISGTGTMKEFAGTSSPWFRKRGTISSVVIESGVTNIGSNAFNGCSNITSVTIPRGVTSIGERAFFSCNYLTSVAIPDGVTSIGDHAFEFSGLTAITIPSTINNIGNEVFGYCSNLKSVTIPESVISIGDYAFYDCTALTDVYYTGTATQWAEITIGSYNEDLWSVTVHYIIASGTCGDNLTWTLDSEGTLTISGTGAMYDYCYDDISSHPWNNVAESIEKVVIANGVTTIGAWAFSGCSSLTAITIPDSVTSIGWYAFSGCSSLTAITIPDSVTSIDYEAFWGCSSLTAITIPDGVTSIGHSAFYDCSSMESITIGNSVTSIGGYAFYGCSSLTAITIPDSVTSIGRYAFEDCSSMESITIGNSVTSIGEDAFRGCTSLKSITIGNSVTSIGRYAFYGCSSLKSITIGNSVASIDYGAFRGCSSLTAITIPDSVTSIGGYAFSNCSSLTSVTIPDSVTSIGEAAFWLCDDLENVYYSGTQAQWDAIAIGESNEDLTNATIHYNHIHDYTLIAPVVVPATCTQAGYIEYTCAYGETMREVLESLLGHTTGTNAVITAPTCTEQGYTTSNCATCGVRVVTDYVPALGHDYTGEVITKEPTCTEQGYTGPKCTRCDSVRQDTITDSLGHKIVAGGNVAPTCTEKGHTGGTVCQNCNIWFIQPTWSDALGHSFTNYIKNQDGTMTATCDNCDAVDIIGAKAAAIGELTYPTLAAALEAAKGGETVRLLMDADVEEVLLTGGVTLDLNGCTLTVDALTAFAEGLADGYIVDSSAGNTGLLIVEKEKATFKSTNPDMPLYDAVNGGYRFFDYKLTLHSKPTNVDTGKEKFWFKFHFYTDDTCTELDSDAYGIVAAGGSGMEVRTALTWKGKELPKVLFAKDGSADTFVKDWADDATAARWLYVTVSGLDQVGFGVLKVTPTITVNGVVAQEGAISYEVKQFNTGTGWDDFGPGQKN